MGILTVLFWIVGLGLVLFMTGFVIASWRESQKRAAAVALGLSHGIGAIWWVIFQLADGNPVWLAVPVGFVVVLTAAYFIPLGRTTSIAATPDSEKVDERDVMFTREEYEPGTARYDEYYSKHPELKSVDDRLRRLPRLLDPGGKYYDAEVSEDVKRTFGLIADLAGQVDGKVSSNVIAVDADEITRELKGWTIMHGAADVGIAHLNQAWVYSHVGRGPEPWGEPIVNNHKYAIVFTLEMSQEAVDSAPALPITHESARQYLLAAEISVQLARRIREMGYSARAHVSDSNYQIMLPPVAQDAGLGELGRMGYLISPRLGARVRLGAITTDIPLEIDHPVSFGVNEFCETCKKCAINCPSAAISHEDKSTVRGIHKWPIDVERCVRYWRLIGTDCGLCMRVCPYSHPRTFYHNLVRAGIHRSSFARTVSVWGDDLFYGRKLKYPKVSDDWKDNRPSGDI